MSIFNLPLYTQGFEVLVTALIATVSAQAMKVLWNLVFRKPVDFQVLVQTGGMPSSHSAMIIALATSVGLNVGFRSVPFAIALGQAMVVMYDAAGVRRAAGRMAGILNRMTVDLYQHHPDKVPERLRELLGHTPIEVIAGALWGVATAFWIHQAWKIA